MNIDVSASFCRLVRQNKISDPITTINDYVDYWHNSSNTEKNLSSFLGFTPYEYKMWTKYPNKLIQILDGEFIEWLLVLMLKLYV